MKADDKVKLTDKQTVVLQAIMEYADRARIEKPKQGGRDPISIAFTAWGMHSVRQMDGFAAAWGSDRASSASVVGIAKRLVRRGLVQCDTWRQGFWPTEAAFKHFGRRVPRWLDRVDVRGQLHSPLIRSTDAERDAAETLLKTLDDAGVLYYGAVNNSARNVTIKALREVQTAVQR